MTTPPRVLTERDGSVGWVRINRPERLNSFSERMRDDLAEALQTLDDDPDVHCVIVTGVGRAFSTGGDVRVMSKLIDDDDIASFEELVRAGARVVRLIEHMRKPVIAAVNGPAAGAGACLALACDLRIASETASIGFTFVRVGLHPDWGGTYFLARLVGAAAAAECIYTGGMINAERGERLGLFNRVVPASELETAAKGLAGQIAAGPFGVMSNAKRVLRRAIHSSLEEVLELEVQAQLQAFRSNDFREGITAFIEKRAPRFNRKGHHNGNG